MNLIDLMEFRKSKILTAALGVSLLVLLVILWLCLGLSRLFFILAGVDLAIVLAIFIWVLIQNTATDRKRKSMARRTTLEGEELRLEYSFLRRAAGLPAKFRYEILEAATDNFQSLIGRGSSASVFKGILDDGTPVAVKRIEGLERGEREFRSEVAAIASVQHVSLVRLLGYCIVQRGPRYLVYEYIHNGSLNQWIFPRRSEDRDHEQEKCLPWALRYRVAIDVARALSYLHHDCRCRILHLDVKPENILLDESFRARVSDFGLSKLMGKDQSRIVTTVRGTRGYLAPEWFLESGISEKSDIYSYGMVLLEIVGGRRNVRLVGDGGDASQRKWSYFPRIVSEKAREGKMMEVVDERLLMRREEEEEKQVKVLISVALWCIQEKARLRPSMARVVDMLEGRMAVDAPPPDIDTLIVDFLSIDEEEEPPAYGPAGARPGSTSALPHRLMEIQEPSMSTCSFALSTLSGR